MDAGGKPLGASYTKVQAANLKGREDVNVGKVRETRDVSRAEMQDEGAVETFQAITGADRATAEHVLEAHGWDLNRGVDFFVESAGLPARAAAVQGPQAEPLGRTSSVIDVDDEPVTDETEDVPDDSGLATGAARFQSDNDLQAALAASLRTGDGAGEGPAGVPTRRSARGYAADDDELTALKGEQPQLPTTEGRFGLLPGFDDEDTPGPRVRRNRPRGARAPDLEMAHLAAMGMAAGIPPTFAEAFGGAGPVGPEPASEANGNGQLDLPAGINMEEARMLEAAMLGVPYEGRVPDFRNQAPSEPVSSSVLHQRALREEQDQAYQESLLADRRKADAAETAQREQDEVRRKRLQAEEDAAQAQRNYEREISDKLEGLPEEPPADCPGAVNVMIRLPNGNRFSRRFLRSSLCGHLFDYVDVNAAPDCKPGSYSLVTQFPRRVFRAGKEGSLAEAGLTQKQEALFLEPV